MGRSRYGSEFDRVVRWLRREVVGTKFKVRVVTNLTEDGDACHGSAIKWVGEKIPYVYLDAGLHYDEAVFTLLEEVAHLIDIRKNGYLKDADDQHTDGWGITYASLRRGYARWLKQAP